MRNLLKAELKTLFHWKATKYAVGFMLLLAALMEGVAFLNEEPAMGSMTSMSAIILLVASAIGGLFVYLDYSQNTIRNKIAVGYSRLECYISKSIAVFTLFFILVAGSMLIMGGIAYGFMDTEYVVWEAFWKNCMIVFTSVVTVSVLTSMLAINIQSPLGGLLPMMFTTAVFLTGIFGMEMLYINEAEEIIKIVQSIPVICLVYLSETVVPENFWLSVIIACAVSVSFFWAGYLTFRKADLK